MTLIIGLSGRKQSGKNSAAEYCISELIKNGIDARQYSFADRLKQDVCISLLGLKYESCYGTDAEKNAPTHLRWENMPGVVTSDRYPGWLTKGLLYHHPPGPMSGRDVMQYVGTEVFRKMYGEVWVQSTIGLILKEKPKVAFLTDVRFPNEVEGVRRIRFAEHCICEGYVCRLSRIVFPKDYHVSETALDGFADWDLLVGNQELSVEQTNELVWKWVQSLL